VKTGTW